MLHKVMAPLHVLFLLAAVSHSGHHASLVKGSDICYTTSQDLALHVLGLTCCPIPAPTAP
jgi:hypothetical protein